MPAIRELDRAGLAGLGGEVFRQLEAGDILVVRGLDEIQRLIDHVETVFAARHGTPDAARVRALFAGEDTIDEDLVARLALILREIRDTRFLSCLFADLIAGFGLPPPLLIDTGHFRFIVPRQHAALVQRQKRGELPRDLFEAENVSEPEPMLGPDNSGGHPHRDVDVPHYTFQMNFWFPLHPLPPENSLLMFPDVYTADIPYQQTPVELRRPESWGYGVPFKRALQVGDALLFHSQHLHASPTGAPDRHRLVAELRVASACHDDNANLYRRLFWRIENFAGAGPSQERAAHLHPHDPGRPINAARSPQDLFAALFPSAAAARHAASAWTPDTIFAASAKRPAPVLLDIAARLRAAPLAEDRQLSFVRYLLFHGHPRLARLTLEDVVKRTTSYFFALEAARMAGNGAFYDVAEVALHRALALARASTIQLGQYRGDVPVRPWPHIQLLPAEAAVAAQALLEILARYRAAPTEAVAPWLDHRLWFRNYRTADPFCAGAVIFAWSLLLYVPLERFVDVGLRVADRGTDTAISAEGFRPEAIAGDPTGIVLGYNNIQLFQQLQEMGILRPEPSGAPAPS